MPTTKPEKPWRGGKTPKVKEPKKADSSPSSPQTPEPSATERMADFMRRNFLRPYELGFAGRGEGVAQTSVVFMEGFNRSPNVVVLPEGQLVFYRNGQAFDLIDECSPIGLALAESRVAAACLVELGLFSIEDYKEFVAWLYKSTTATPTATPTKPSRKPKPQHQDPLDP